MDHKVVNQEQWIDERKKLMQREKEFTKERDALSAARRELPWVKVDKSYTFQSANGPVSLGDLFAGQKQLIVYHFMYGADWDGPCKSCSFWADNFDHIPIHLRHRDTNMVAIAHAPYEMLAALKQRMGWTFDFFSSSGSDFNYDFGVSGEEGKQTTYNFDKSFEYDEMPGVSVFYKDDDGTIYRTYSVYSRGIDILNGAYNYLDLTPMGRHETNRYNPAEWLRMRDRYED